MTAVITSEVTVTESLIAVKAKVLLLHGMAAVFEDLYGNLWDLLQGNEEHPLFNRESANMNIVIRQMQEEDIDFLAKVFHPLNKPRDQFEMFWREHQAGNRVTFVACIEEKSVGYTNLVWKSDYKSFDETGIPEINNMHILDEFQKQGIGTALIQEAEKIALMQGKEEIGIGFGLTPDYGTAQRLYPKLGYIPDGRGA